MIYQRCYSVNSATQAFALFAYLILAFTPLAGIASNLVDKNDKKCTDGLFPIAVHVQGLRNNEGTIKAKLYSDNPDEFLVSGKKLYARRVPAQQQALPLCLYAPKPGSYAIVIHHDENGNKKLDQNWIGMPVEGVGFSNNPELFLAPPKHEDVTFEVQESPVNVDIQLRY